MSLNCYVLESKRESKFLFLESNVESNVESNLQK